MDEVVSEHTQIKRTDTNKKKETEWQSKNLVFDAGSTILTGPIRVSETVHQYGIKFYHNG